MRQSISDLNQSKIINGILVMQSNREFWQRIFVNRSLNMTNIKAIGFDMDHTLLIYNRLAFESLAFQETLKKLIANGYPDALMQLEFKPNLLIRGLLVDMDRGNLLKVDGHKYCKVAYHGTRPLRKDERHELYNSKSFRAQDFLSMDTLFALSEVQLFVEIVDFMDSNPQSIKKSYREVYADIRKFIDNSHQDGSIKSHVVKTPERYIRKDKHLATALMRLHDGGKKLFLLTNSAWDYTNAMMSYLLNGELEDFEKWTDYFDQIIVSSGKPGFFTGTQPFYQVIPETGLLKTHTGPFVTGQVYQGGCASLFQVLTKFKGDEILYVGDHIFGDIMQSKGKLNWRTLLVIEELESEIQKLMELKPTFQQIQESFKTKEDLEEEVQILNSKVASLQRQKQKAEERGDQKKLQAVVKEIQSTKEKLESRLPVRDQIETDLKDLVRIKESAMHPLWGELMKTGLERSRFAYQVEGFACLYTAKVSHLRFYSPHKMFNSFNDLLPHDP